MKKKITSILKGLSSDNLSEDGSIDNDNSAKGNETGVFSSMVSQVDSESLLKTFSCVDDIKENY